MRITTANASAATIRTVTEGDGRQYFVAPVAMLTPGIHSGSGGPLYYPPEELKRNPAAWNGIPITVGHPATGAYVAGQTPTVGSIKKARYDGKLRAEAWIDVEALALVAPSAQQALARGEVLEVSTGLYVDEIAGSAVPGGKAYRAVAANHVPDHLALLLDQRGACSRADGCGLPVANAIAPNRRITMHHHSDYLPLPRLNFGEEAEPTEAETGKPPGLPLPTSSCSCEEPGVERIRATVNYGGAAGEEPLRLPSTL